MMELHNQTTERTNWTSYWFGCFAGIVPWIAIAIYLAGAANPPGFVYAIFASLFVFFNVFAVNMLLQYRRVGRWSDYLYGERVYMLLSLFAKSLLAWQVFAGPCSPPDDCTRAETESYATRRRVSPSSRPAPVSLDSASASRLVGGSAGERQMARCARRADAR